MITEIVIAKLVDGGIGKCIGKEIGDDGDIVNSRVQSLVMSVWLTIFQPSQKRYPEKVEERR
jgi:hypothetical protein